MTKRIAIGPPTRTTSSHRRHTTGSPKASLSTSYSTPSPQSTSRRSSAIRARLTRSAAIPSSDDGRTALVLLRHRTRSSRRIMKRCHVDVAAAHRWRRHPDFRTISDFRKIHLARLEALFSRSSALPLAGLARSAPSLSMDQGQGQRSRHKAMSYDRMKTKRSGSEGDRRHLAEAQTADNAEDFQHGPDRHGDELPDELARRQSRLAKIPAARRLLEERARSRRPRRLLAARPRGSHRP